MILISQVLPIKTIDKMENSIVVNKQTFEVIKRDWIAQSGLAEAAFNKEVSFALQVLSLNPTLKECSSESIVSSVLNVAQIGLSLNPSLRYAYLVPRWSNKNKRLEAVLDPGYQGLAKLLTDSGSVKNISCQIVYEGDEVEVDFASNEKIKKHSPYFLSGKSKGKVLAVYSLATLPDGSKHVEIMSAEEINEIRERSESYKALKAGKIKTCIWESDYAEMCRKTVIKRHFKYLPKTDALDRLNKAIEADNNANGYKASESQISYIESLVWTATIDEKKKQAIEREMFEYDHIQASDCILYLKQNQPLDLNQQYKQATDV